MIIEMLNTDILFSIFEYLSYNVLKKVSLASKRFYQIIKKYNLLAKAKLYRFPRSSGTCKYFDILQNYSYILGEGAEKYYDDFIIPNSLLLKVCDHSDTIGMVRGDIVIMKGFDNLVGSYINDGSYLFDGACLINLSILKQEEREKLLLTFIDQHKITLGYWYSKKFQDNKQLYVDKEYNFVMGYDNGIITTVGKMTAQGEIVSLTPEDIIICNMLNIKIR